MATLYGVNYTKTEISKPSEKVAPGELNGRCRVLYDEITLAAEAANGDEIYFSKLPAGARVLGAALLVSGSLGAGGLSLGNVASASGAVAADDDAFVDLADASASAARSEMSDGVSGSPGVPVAGHLKKFDEEVVVAAKFTANTVTGTGKKISAAVFYSLD